MTHRTSSCSGCCRRGCQNAGSLQPLAAQHSMAQYSTVFEQVTCRQRGDVRTITINPRKFFGICFTPVVSQEHDCPRARSHKQCEHVLACHKHNSSWFIWS